MVLFRALNDVLNFMYTSAADRTKAGNLVVVLTDAL